MIKPRSSMVALHFNGERAGQKKVASTNTNLTTGGLHEIPEKQQ
jgi:hypothetical protein